ncbi:secretion protein HlyD family protein [Rhodopirellula maiorica SM1]|uniref:Secretion protein HlyD family protein n=1 Tax=Rhodopirellula maiorica SM1 TaxID=1265738 RepID=M5RBU2_9BACT|nr:efflux RND transporter periplasmic adaptor subunit [Rhodopirellula maiorica]EMI16541.1 secretion protein HlyD family protein [Rhodopirellula maiorica SM1]
MKLFISTIVVVLVCVPALLVYENQRQSQLSDNIRMDATEVSRSLDTVVIRAAGRIEGRTEQIDLRARIAEQIDQIHVTQGQWVEAGEVLLSLDSELLLQERNLAAAMLEMEEAKKERLENGYRPSEIETAKQEYHAAVARLEGAQKTYDRGVKLSENNAISWQTLDNMLVDLGSLRATAAAAKSRLETLEMPPRNDDMMAAMASVRAAESRLRIAQINLDRSRITAPSAGRILSVDAEVGEMTAPTSAKPLIIMSDTSQLRAVAEVDEYDALNVVVGQVCAIKSDAAEGILAKGEVVEIEPLMNPKQMFGQWAGERTDTYSRRVWINLDDAVDLPVGLPVEIYIETK